MFEVNEIWNICKNQCKELLGNSAYEVWIKRIEPVEYSDGKFTVSVSNKFIVKIIEAKYKAVIEDLLQGITGDQLQLLICVNDCEIKDVKIPDLVNPPAQVEEIREKPVKAPCDSGINRKYTFDNFVVGNSNRIAYAAAKRVAEMPVVSYNPLFIYGASGLGKTHLMHAIGNYICQKNPDRKVIYITSEKFINEIVEAIRKSSTDAFRHKYRNIDCLLIDDIQFIKGKIQTQIEFFHTFNALYEENKQIVICSDRPPKEIDALEERLCSRFSGGMLADVQAPDLETRLAILRQKSIQDGIAIPNDAAELIAASNITNVRELEGVYTKVIVHSGVLGEPITAEMVQKVLTDMAISSGAKVITMEMISDCVEAFFNLRHKELRGKGRTKTVAHARQIAMYMSREIAEESYSEIGRFFNRNHATVMHDYEKIVKELIGNNDLLMEIKEIKCRIKE